MIKFVQDKYIETISTTDVPVFHIEKILFNSNDKNWVSRLATGSITFKITCFDSNDRELKSYQTPIMFVEFITSQHIQPVLYVDRIISFKEKYFDFNDENKVHHWTVIINVHNISLVDKESLEIYFVDSKLINKKRQHYIDRVDDWKKRISNLYSEIQNWITDKSEYNLKTGQPIIMYEELMETFGISPTLIDTLDIYKNGKLHLSFKPKGLWVVGANGRIDIIHSKGSFILVDDAEQFATPKWKLYTNSKNGQSAIFNNETFLSIL